MLSRLANMGKDYVLFNRGLESFWQRRARGTVTSLLYHRVDAPERFPFLARGGSPVIAPESFREEMQFLVRNRATFFTFSQLGSGEFPKPEEFGVAICFDDCFVDNYTTAVDILREFGIAATFFQSTAMVDATELLWEHRLYWHTRDEAHGTAFKRLAEKTLPRGAQVDSVSVKRLVEHLREAVPWDICRRVLEAADAELGRPGEMEQVAQRIYPK